MIQDAGARTGKTDAMLKMLVDEPARVVAVISPTKEQAVATMKRAAFYIAGKFHLTDMAIIRPDGRVVKFLVAGDPPDDRLRGFDDLRVYDEEGRYPQ